MVTLTSSRVARMSPATPRPRQGCYCPSQAAALVVPNLAQWSRAPATGFDQLPPPHLPPLTIPPMKAARISCHPRTRRCPNHHLPRLPDLPTRTPQSFASLMKAAAKYCWQHACPWMKALGLSRTHLPLFSDVVAVELSGNWCPLLLHSDLGKRGRRHVRG
jgi:hypothetical protein